MNLFNISKLALVVWLLQGTYVHATEQVGVIASISPKKQRTTSFAVDSRLATQHLKAETDKQTKSIYWFDRNDSDSYHTTVALLKKEDGHVFSDADYEHLKHLLDDFSSQAPYLNKKVAGQKKAYKANGYELRLFVHFKNQTSAQYSAKNIGDLLQVQQDISYANIVLKLGTGGDLKKDWDNVGAGMMDRAHFVRANRHDLETHITIGSLYKYTKKDNEVIGGKVVSIKENKKVFNTPFLCAQRTELQLLVDTFNSVNGNTDWNKLQNIMLDRLQVTGKVNGQIKLLRDVRFNPKHEPVAPKALAVKPMPIPQPVKVAPAPVTVSAFKQPTLGEALAGIGMPRAPLVRGVTEDLSHIPAQYFYQGKLIETVYEGHDAGNPVGLFISHENGTYVVRGIDSKKIFLPISYNTEKEAHVDLTRRTNSIKDVRNHFKPLRRK
jgi:hypothetical protein